VPETNYLVSLLDELQRSGQEMVVVVDEFGQISGIVTMTQLLEEIIGPINEDILDDDDFFVLDNTTCLVNGGARIADVNERFGIVIPDGDYETLAGFILEVLGRIPVVGDEYKLDDVQFSISRMRGMRIARIKVVVPAALLNQNYELDIL
jgi:CBS domain containing-hemolysin-like protein